MKYNMAGCSNTTVTNFFGALPEDEWSNVIAVSFQDSITG
jgi:hypothetical protein